MKRILKWVLIVIITIVVLGVIAFLGIRSYMLPSGEFSAESVPAKPDYSDTSFWISLPSIQDTADLIPPNANTKQDLTDKSVDVFFVHSTGYVGPGGWNSNMDKQNSEAQSNEYMLSSMASAFNGCCEIYAPTYRQAHLAAFGDDDVSSSYKALDLAYQDVESAFEYFLTHHNKGRPFMIVGHSQGSLHALRLLANKVDGTALRSQLVAAYTVGYWLPLTLLERNFEHIGLCDSASETGCIVSFDTYGEGGGLSQGQRHWFKSGWEATEKQTIACVNPLSWNTDTAKADAELHLGAFPVEFKRTIKYMLLAKNPGFKFSELPALTANLTWAKCDESGVLHVEQQKDNAFSNHLDAEDKSYHLLDYSLFYGNIRANSKYRVRAYVANQ